MKNKIRHRASNFIKGDSRIDEIENLMRQGKMQAAASICQNILAHASRHPQAAYFYGLILCNSGTPEAGKPWLKIAASAMPNRADVINDWATCLKICGEFVGAEKNYRKALKINPNLPEAWDNLVDIYHAIDDKIQALDSCNKYLSFRPDDAGAWTRLSKLQSRLGLFYQAITSAKKSLELDQDNSTAQLAICRALILSGQANSEQIEAINKDKNSLDFQDWQNFLFLLNAIPDLPATELAQHHFEFSEKLAQEFSKHKPKHSNINNPDRPLKIGLVSGDLRSHPVGYFLEALLQHLNHENFQLTAYANQSSFDTTSTRLRKHCVHWKEVAKLSNQILHKMIVDDQIDILIDLSGHTDGNRLAVFAAKAAPVQVTYLGYFATTGLSSIDYILCNEDLIPSKENKLYSETPWHLPDAHICYSPHSDPLPVMPRPQNSQHITFGCFNRLIKINDAVLDAWAAILDKVQNSHLLIINGEMADKLITSTLLARFIERGINPSRIILEPSMEHKGYLEAHNRVDIMLDPFPYNGTTTTMDALWMGVPVLTLHGDRYGAHMAEAVLKQAGLHDWVAKDKDDYVRLAVEFAANPQALTELRTKIRDRLLSSPLLDAPRFAKNFEAALRGMWRKWCNDQASLEKTY